MKKIILLTVSLFPLIELNAMTATKVREQVKVDVDVAALPQCFCVVPCEENARSANGLFRRYKSNFFSREFFPNLKHSRERRQATIAYMNYLFN